MRFDFDAGYLFVVADPQLAQTQPAQNQLGLLDLGGKITPEKAEAGLTDIAEVCVEGGLELARVEMARRGTKPTQTARRRSAPLYME